MSVLCVTIGGYGTRNADREVTTVPLSSAQWGLYPEDWAQISWAVRERAGHRCECHGECERPDEHLEAVDGRCRNRHGQTRWRGQRWQSPVFLSAAHLDHDPTVRDLDRLRALCPGCHLAFDRAQHAATRHANRERELGLISLFDLV
jgi:hypothetical protein